jgi:hypothetical protein
VSDAVRGIGQFKSPFGGLSLLRGRQTNAFIMKGLILAQNERWRRGLGMQVERESGGNSASRVAKG